MITKLSLKENSIVQPVGFKKTSMTGVRVLVFKHAGKTEGEVKTTEALLTLSAEKDSDVLQPGKVEFYKKFVQSIGSEFEVSIRADKDGKFYINPMSRLMTDIDQDELLG